MYILESITNGSYYVGHTMNLTRRIEEHNRGEEKSTRSGCPWRLVHYDVYSTRSEAVRREREIKARKKRAFIEKLISERSAAR